MSVVTELGYLGLSVSDLAAWRAYAAEVAGMEVVDEGEGDRLYLRMAFGITASFCTLMAAMTWPTWAGAWPGRRNSPRCRKS